MPTKADADSAQLQRKATVIEEIRQRLDASDAAVLTEYRGLTVTEIANLRAALRPASTDYKIFKNTLARRAASDAGLADLVEHLEGPVAIAFVRQDGGDAVTAAKALRDFARTNPNLIVKGGILGTRAAHDEGSRSPRRRAAARRAARPPRRWLPGPARRRRPACSRPSPATSPTASRPTSTSAPRQRSRRRRGAATAGAPIRPSRGCRRRRRPTNPSPSPGRRATEQPAARDVERDRITGAQEPWQHPAPQSCSTSSRT